MPTGFLRCAASIKALFRIMDDESAGVPVKSWPASSFIPIVLVKSTSVAMPDTMICALVGMPSQDGAGERHHTSVIGEDVRTTDFINPDFNKSFFIAEKLLSVDGVDGTISRLLGL